MTPQTFMNDSGAALPPLFERFECERPSDLIVVYDDLALPLGKAASPAKRFGRRPQWDKINNFDFGVG